MVIFAKYADTCVNKEGVQGRRFNVSKDRFLFSEAAIFESSILKTFLFKKFYTK